MSSRDDMAKILTAGLWPLLRDLGFERIQRRVFVRRQDPVHWLVGFSHRNFSYYDMTAVYYVEVDRLLQKLIPERLKHRYNKPAKEFKQPCHFKTIMSALIKQQNNYRELKRMSDHKPQTWLERKLAPKPEEFIIGPPGVMPHAEMPKLTWMQRKFLPYLQSRPEGQLGMVLKKYIPHKHSGFDPFRQDPEQMAIDLRDHWRDYCLPWLEACDDMRFALSLPWYMGIGQRFEPVVMAFMVGDEELASRKIGAWRRIAEMTDEELFERRYKALRRTVRDEKKRAARARASVQPSKQSGKEIYEIFQIIAAHFGWQDV